MTELASWQKCECGHPEHAHGQGRWRGCEMGGCRCVKFEPEKPEAA